MKPNLHPFEKHLRAMTGINLCIWLVALTLLPASYANGQQKLKGFENFNYFGGYGLGSITFVDKKYPETPAFRVSSLNSKCFDQSNFMPVTTVNIADMSLSTTKKFTFNISDIPSGVSPAVKSELQSVRSVTLKVTSGSRSYYSEGAEVAFKSFVSKLCKEEISSIIKYLAVNPKAFVISEIVTYNKSIYEFAGSGSLSAEAKDVLKNFISTSATWSSNSVLEINSPTEVYYKKTPLKNYATILTQSEASLTAGQCPTPSRGTEDVTVPSVRYSLNPPLVGGDNEFFGHGPKVTITFSFNISPDRKSILASLTMDAIETGGDVTHAYGVSQWTYYNAPNGYYIHSIPSQLMYYGQSAIDTDTDQGNDFLPPGGPLASVIYTGDIYGGDVGVPGGTGTVVDTNAIPIKITKCNLFQ